MTVSQLLRQQRDILHSLHNILKQYQQKITQAEERLEHILEQIQSEKTVAEQEAKREYEQARDKYIATVLDAKLPMSGVKEEQRAKREQEREELRAELLSASKKREALHGIDDINMIIENIRGIAPKNTELVARKTVKASPIVIASSILSLILSLCLLLSLLGLLNVLNVLLNPPTGESNWSGLMILMTCISPFLISGLLIIVSIPTSRHARRVSNVMKESHKSSLTNLNSLYYRWLELIAHQTQTRNTEAQQAHQQALEQAKQQLLDNVQQLRPTVLDYITLADQSSPPWQSETWQNWKPGTLTPGVVRLGAFTLRPDQLESKPVTILKVIGIAGGRLPDNSGGAR